MIILNNSYKLFCIGNNSPFVINLLNSNAIINCYFYPTPPSHTTQTHYVQPLCFCLMSKSRLLFICNLCLDSSLIIRGQKSFSPPKKSSNFLNFLMEIRKLTNKIIEKHLLKKNLCLFTIFSGYILQQKKI